MPTHLYTLTGGSTTDGVIAHSVLSADDVGASVDLAVSTARDLSRPVFLGRERVDEDGILRHTVAGLEPDTQYYGRLATSRHGLFGERFAFKTMPTGDGAWSMRVILGSCQNNLASNVTELAWQDALAWGAHRHMHLGDWGYWGQDILSSDPYQKDLSKYTKSIAGLPSMRAVLHLTSLDVVCISDHELSVNGDNFPDWPGMFDAPESIRELLAFQALMPIRSYGDLRTPRRGRYYSFDIGQQVRVIVTDFRTPDRSDSSDLDGPAKTMFGATQLQWLLDSFDSAKVNLLVNETSWLGSPIGSSVRAADKPWHYRHEQQIIADHILDRGIKVAWLGGDRHYLGYLRGSDDGSGIYNTLGEFPCYIASGWQKESLDLQSGELMTWWSGQDHPRSKREVCQYMRLTLSFDGDSTVTLSAVARAVADTTRPVSTWTMSTIGTASDSWPVGAPEASRICRL